MNILLYSNSKGFGHIVTSLNLAKILEKQGCNVFFAIRKKKEGNDVLFDKRLIQLIKKKFKILPGKAESMGQVVKKYKINKIVIEQDLFNFSNFPELACKKIAILVAVHKYKTYFDTLKKFDAIIINGLKDFKIDNELKKTKRIVFRGCLRNLDLKPKKKRKDILFYIDSQYGLGVVEKAIDAYKKSKVKENLLIYAPCCNLQLSENKILTCTKPLGYEQFVGKVAESKLVITTAGLGLIYESILLKTPRILIPGILKSSGKQAIEQLNNARIIKENKAGSIFQPFETPEKLAKLIKKNMQDKNWIQQTIGNGLKLTGKNDIKKAVKIIRGI